MSRCSLAIIAVALLVVGVAVCGCRTAGPPVGDSSTLIQEAQTVLDEGKVDAAIDKLQEALKIDDDSAEAHFMLGKAYHEKGLFAQSEQQFLRVVKLNEEDTDALSNLGVAYYHQGKLQKAEEVFQKALVQAPNDAEIRYNLGGVLVALGRAEEAVAEFVVASELDPAMAQPYLGLGTAYKLQGKRDEAVSALREYLKRSNDPAWRDEAEKMLAELGAKP